MHASWVSLLPFLIVIPVSIWTKQVLPGLFVALIAGCYLKAPTFMGGLREMLNYTVDNLVKSNNTRIILFLYVFAGLINMIKMAGGIKGFVHLVSKKVKTKRSAMLLTWLTTMGTFSDPDFRIVTISPIMKALRKRLKMSAQNIGFAIEVTSNPVVGLIPIATAFVGYMVSVIDTALKHNGIHEKAYTVYVKSIPFNFYSFVIILVGLYYSFFKHSKQDMNSADQPSEQGNEEEEVLKMCHRAYEEDTPAKPWNLILPLSVVLILTLFLSWWDGRAKAKGFFDAFLHSDALGVMLESLLIGFIFTLAFLLFQRFSIQNTVKAFVDGGNELMSVIILLVLIWSVSTVSEDLGFSTYITDHVKGWIPHFFIAPVIFLLGGLISYFIGSSWGTWGLLMPLGVTLAHQADANILLVIGAVFASGTFGAFTSPLSDNTVTLCTILDLPVIQYARTKLVPSLIAAGISVILFGAAAFLLK
ncbi:Na+/H+ antiporter NhaC family protein [Ferviditalea candida]|uniref:Na+/H+ antiporter NhaC family protein n=1 Tax=Ferviditalea candida TaxID=3108399 RepID=A0ABU5ZD07_9BACL|nr:Na+/H+ antiporter NhaC family protein [Paenibacillaceae bacterium T2]